MNTRVNWYENINFSESLEIVEVVKLFYFSYYWQLMLPYSNPSIKKNRIECLKLVII